MSRTINEDIKNLKTYKKEEILEALEHTARCKVYNVDLITGDMLRYLKNKKIEESNAAFDKAIKAEEEATEAYIKWHTEMAEKYGDGESFKVINIPMDEIERGAELEKRMKKSIKKVLGM